MPYKNKGKLYLAPLKKLKMNKAIKAVSLLILISVFYACKKDDGYNIVPPRDYGEQYAAELPLIEEYLKTHYIESVSADFDISLKEIPEGGTQVSIWDQEEYRLQFKMVKSNDVDYKVYYLVLNEGVGDAPTRGDNVITAYRGTILDGTQFDYRPFPDSYSSLAISIEGWQEIIPLFRAGLHDDSPSPDPATFTDYGAGVMFLPSGLAYFNSSPNSVIGAYESLIFTFKLYAVEYTDLDGDGILNKDETEPGIDIKDYDTDGDGTPNYLDADDDNDGHSTKNEITNQATGERYSFDEIPTCEGGTLKRHLDPACHE